MVELRIVRLLATQVEFPQGVSTRASSYEKLSSASMSCSLPAQAAKYEYHQPPFRTQSALPERHSEIEKCG